MTKLPVVKTRFLIRALKRAGFEEKKQVGSHLRLKHPDGRWTTVSVHSGTVPSGTLRKILRDAEISPEELKNLL